MNSAKCLRALFLTEHLQWLLRNVSTWKLKLNINATSRLEVLDFSSQQKKVKGGKVKIRLEKLALNNFKAYCWQK